MLEYRLYRDCFAGTEMRAIWSEHATISAWLKVEQTLAKCQAEAGLIPTEAATAIGAISVCDIDPERLQQDMMLAGRPIVGLVRQMREKLGENARFVHFNATTQDIMDTAMVLQMKLGVAEVQSGLNRIIGRIERHAELQGNTMLMGRTNGQHAVPIRLATKLEVWTTELQRRADAISDAARRGLNVQIGGPVGDLRTYVNGEGTQIKQAVAASLELHAIDPHWQNARDGVADIVAALGALCATLCKIAHNVNLLSSSEIGEMSEAHEPGKGASSAMPHKRNQRASEFAEAVARLGRQQAAQFGELTLHEHERSGGVWIAEWVVVPKTFLLTSGAISWIFRLFDDLVIDVAAMERKLPGPDGTQAIQSH